MKKRLLPALLISALLTFTLCALAACGGSGSSGSSASSSAPAAKATEFSFFSVVVPDGYTANEKQHYVSANPGGSMAVSVHNVSADELLETELKDSDFKEGDTLTAGSFTWKAATSDKWNQTYYITDWENGCIEVNVKNVDDPEIVKAFLASLTPFEGAYEKWQAEF
jgi:hypothetical protein